MITTKRLTIRPIEENDWIAIKEIWDDFKNTEFVIYDNDKDTSPESLQPRIAKWAEATRKGNEHMFFATCLKGETIGFTSMNIVAPSEYEIGYGYTSKSQGHGFAKEALTAILDGMKELGATMLCCTPSYATYLAETIREMGIDPSELKLKSGCFGAEPWTEEMRQHLEELLDFDAFDIYGLTEIGGPGVAFECFEKNGMHINEDHVLAEIIDPVTEEPLPDGVPGELVFTTLTKTGTPMIRYRTHDICTLTHGTCACGRTTVKMSRITGRTDDMLVIRGVNVFPSQIESVLLGVEEASTHYMLVVDRVNSQDKLTVQVELKEDEDMNDAAKLAAIAARIKTDIKQTLLISAKVELVPPKTIPRSEGKAKRITDNRHIGF